MTNSPSVDHSGASDREDFPPLGPVSERRSFLKRAVVWGFALISGLAAASLLTLSPIRLKKKTSRFVSVLPIEDVPRLGVKVVRVPRTMGDSVIEQRAFLVATDQGLLALSSQCTHLGCSVNWDGGLKEFVCPCHGGRYDSLGRPKAGPPPAPLAVLPLRVEGGFIQVAVETGTGGAA